VSVLSAESILNTSQQKKGATSEGKVPAAMMKTIMNKLDVESQVMKEQHPVGNLGVEEKMFGERCEPVAEDRVIRNKPHNGIRTLPPRPGEEQQITGLQEDDTAPSDSFDTKTSSLVQID